LASFGESSGPLLMSRSEVARYLDLDGCINAVEAAFRVHGAGQVPPPAVASVPASGGAFHVKAGLFGTEPEYFAAKLNANFMDNRRIGLPTIQGIIALCDGRTGRLLALMDSIEITAVRTGAATAVAAKYLARADARVATICGCGTQGRAQLRALARVCRLEEVHLFDTDPNAAEALAGELTGELGLTIRVVGEPGRAISASDICVTCTPARAAFLHPEMVSPGTFIAAVGADAEHKQELAPELFVGAMVVADVLAQSATMGDLHHALSAGVIQLSEVHSELGEIVAGRKPGRTGADQIIIFDSTGMAIQDAAAAALVYQRRCADEGEVFRFNFGS